MISCQWCVPGKETKVNLITKNCIWSWMWQKRVGKPRESQYNRKRMQLQTNQVRKYIFFSKEKIAWPWPAADLLLILFRLSQFVTTLGLMHTSNIQSIINSFEIINTNHNYLINSNRNYMNQKGFFMSAVIFAALVSVWASRDTTLLRTKIFFSKIIFSLLISTKNRSIILSNVYYYYY